VGGLNIDACRIGTADSLTPGGVRKRPSSGDIRTGKSLGMFQEGTTSTFTQNSLGRWPANFILQHTENCKCVGVKKVKGSLCDKPSDCAEGTGATGKWGTIQGNRPSRGYGNKEGFETIEKWDCSPDCPVRMLDEQTGILKSGTMKAGQERKKTKGGGGYHGDFPDTATAQETYGDSGGASRFFYCAKVSPKERNLGCEDLPNKNSHPTLKPIRLCSYLIKLITPPNGTVIDPFAGSGSICLAAKLLGFNFIGIDNNKDYCEIAIKRLVAYKQYEQLFAGEKITKEEAPENKETFSLNI
jgi:hypothetical protein